MNSTEQRFLSNQPQHFRVVLVVNLGDGRQHAVCLGRQPDVRGFERLAHTSAEIRAAGPSVIDSEQIPGSASSHIADGQEGVGRAAVRAGEGVLRVRMDRPPRRVRRLGCGFRFAENLFGSYKAIGTLFHVDSLLQRNPVMQPEADGFFVNAKVIRDGAFAAVFLNESFCEAVHGRQ